MAYRIFVGKVPDRTNEDGLSKAFSEFGDIKQIELKNGYAFIFYDNPNDAQNAIAKMNGTDLDGSIIVVENARDSRAKLMNRRLDLRVLVHGLGNRVSWQDLKDWARKAGEVTFTNIFDDERGQRLGLVEFKDEQGLENAVTSLESVLLQGIKVRVEKDDPNAPHHNIPPSRGLENRRVPGFVPRNGNNNMEHRGRGNFERQEPPAPYGRGRSSEPPFPPRDRGFDRGGFNDRGPSYGGPPGPGGNGGFDGPPRGGYDRGYDSRRPYSDEYRRSPPPLPPMPMPSGGGGGGGGYYRERSRSRSRGGDRDRYYGGGGYNDRAPNLGPGPGPGGFARSRGGGYDGGRPGEYDDRRPGSGGGGNGPRYYDGPRGYDHRR